MVSAVEAAVNHVIDVKRCRKLKVLINPFGGKAGHLIFLSILRLSCNDTGQSTIDI
jgi:hypothetical protein